MTIEPIKAVTINCPEFFAREDFMDWLRRNITRKEIATWHNGYAAPNEYSDTFIMHDCFDGSNYCEYFPDDIQEAIRLKCESIGFEQGIIRLTNLAE
ncbi:hypothetical protein [Hymenobacter siberiensis]|uniref:hypothetical protein n=1 Tax=Hymenobacter siberiensis TaxID=2848396 RepID=UPI001C1E8B9E|nr:hypothetical protein [Hymenobacter siberiensis]